MPHQQDHQGFDAIVDAYYERIFRGALAVTGDKHLAEEIVQETFLSALRKFDTFSGRSSVFSWLYTIMLNAAYLFIRGVYYLALDDRECAEEGVKMALPYMLDALRQGESVGPPGAYYRVVAIREKNLGEYLALLKLVAGRELCFDPGPDDEAKERKVEEWKQWWEKEGKHQRLDLTAMNERFEAQRRAFRKREVSLAQTRGGTGQ